MVLPHTAFARMFTRALDYSGRSSRSEFWWGQTLLAMALVGLGIVAAMTVPPSMWTGLAAAGSVGIAATVIGGILSVVQITSQMRRLHDTGRSGLWLLVSIVPFLGALILFVLFVLPSEEDSNKWGDGPGAAMRPIHQPNATTGAAAPVTTASKSAGLFGKKPRKASAWDSYAIFDGGGGDLPPHPKVVEARKAEVSDYYRRNVLKQPTALPAE